MLPTDMERQQIFYWLQKVSSVTAWRHILELYKAWAAVTENSVREADRHGFGSETSLPPSDYSLILKGLVPLEAGVNRLAKGDKRVFNFDLFGEFETAGRPLGHWSEMLYRIQTGENAISKHTPFWADFDEALSKLAYAWGDCTMAIHPCRDRSLATPIFYGTWLKAQLKTLDFPNELDLVPDPIENTFVRTYRSLPCAGIWEPIETQKTSFLRSLIKPPKPQPPFKVVGAMNYFTSGACAPHLSVETETDYIYRSTTWRLLWRDDRYTDGTIPEKEAHYNFTNPNTSPERRLAITETGQWIGGNSGRPARFSGRWLVESDLSVSVTLKEGDELPLHQGLEVRWALAKS
ncbi:Imm71 family immunity protein [Duganella sp. S19_KUP01_CR8]|uniref:Imm71 family immunity protein n=1 Tax=Duganella sp. S19_KUP01_CR8 TaxID=3025502 RepID=UPI002FCDE031